MPGRSIAECPGSLYACRHPFPIHFLKERKSMQTKTWLCGVLLAILLALPLFGLAAKPAKQQAPKREVAAMATALNLTAEQQAQVKEKTKALNVSLKDWDVKNKERMDKLNADVKAAREAKDKAAVKQATANLAAAKTERAAIEQAGQKDILTILTPEQQQALPLFQFQETILKRFAKAKLTDDQVTKVKAMCATTLTAINALPEREVKGRQKLTEELMKNIREQVLTDAQREAMKPAPKAKPADQPK